MTLLPDWEYELRQLAHFCNHPTTKTFRQTHSSTNNAVNMLSTTILLATLPLILALPSAPPSSNLPSCTKSLHPWSWSLSSLDYHSSIIFSTPAHQIDGGFISFNLSSPFSSTSQDLVCSATSYQLHDFFYGNQWFQCQDPSAVGVGEDGKRVEGRKAEFQFDRISGRVDVRETWGCAVGLGGREVP